MPRAASKYFLKRKRSGKGVVSSFAPIIASAAAKTQPHTLILGTSPSVKSIEKHQYYGHPNNTFWHIAGSALGFKRGTSSYEEQVAAFGSAGFALWDVLGACKRPGSLDSSIVKGSQEYNDIRSFCQDNPSVQRIVFAQTAASQWMKGKNNKEWLKGSGARFYMRSDLPSFKRTAKLFGKYVREENGPSREALELCVVVSTSPACATPRPGYKEREWHRSVYFPNEKYMPPKTYACAACGSAAHWTVQCSKYPSWHEEIKIKGSKARNEAEERGVRWYV